MEKEKQNPNPTSTMRKRSILFFCSINLTLSNVNSFILPNTKIKISKECNARNQHVFTSNGLKTNHPISSPTETSSMTTDSDNVQLPTQKSQSHINDILSNLQNQHDEEVRRGFDTFGMNDTEEYASSLSSNSNGKNLPEWKDEDFISYDVGIGNAGPDELKMNQANKVFATVKPVFTKDECEALISEAKAHIDAGLKAESLINNNDEQSKRRDSVVTTNSALGEAKVSTLPEALFWLKRNMKHKLLPLLQSRFGLVDLTLNDALIIGYGYFDSESGCASQPIHRDASLVSLNIALSPMCDFEGGGTYFEGVNVGPNYDAKNGKGHSGPIMIEQGHVICHSSGAMHAGNGLQRGERWVLVLFCLSKSIPQLARRCHSEGINLSMDGNIQTARTTFEAGLTTAPNDHLLHISLGRSYLMEGNESRSREYLKKAADMYELDPTSLISLGKMYLGERQAYKAFCQFDLALTRINNADFSEKAWMPLKAAAWDARVNAGRCAVICAEQEAAFDNEKHSNNSEQISQGMRRPFARQFLPKAIERIQHAYNVAPQDRKSVV